MSLKCYQEIHKFTSPNYGSNTNSNNRKQLPHLLQHNNPKALHNRRNRHPRRLRPNHPKAMASGRFQHHIPPIRQRRSGIYPRTTKYRPKHGRRRLIRDHSLRRRSNSMLGIVQKTHRETCSSRRLLPHRYSRSAFNVPDWY